MFDGYGISNGQLLQPSTNLDLVNHSLSSYYDMYLVCSLLANLSSAAATRSMVTGVAASPTSTSLLSADWLTDGDDFTSVPCEDIGTFWKCLYGVAADHKRITSLRNKRITTTTESSSAMTSDFTTYVGDVTTETPYDFVEHLLEENIGIFNHVTDNVLLAVVVVGVLGNIIAAATVVNDSQTPSSWRWFYCSCIGLDQLLLIINITMLSLNAMRPTMSGTDSAAVLSSLPSWWLERLVAMNILGSVLGALQLVQPWFLHLLCGHVRRCLIAERVGRRRHGSSKADKRSLPPLPSFPVSNFLIIVLVGIAFMVVCLPPIRTLLFFMVPGHSTLCNVPLVDHWNLIVDASSKDDPFYLSIYCLLYVFLVYLAPVLPLLHRAKKVIDELAKRPDDIRTDTGLATLCRWSAVVSATTCLHVVGISCKSVLVTMRIVDCACALPLGVTTTVTMLRGDVAFRYLNGFANFGQLVVRPCCHLPVRLAKDWRLRTIAFRVIYRVKRFVVDKLTRGPLGLIFKAKSKLHHSQSAEVNGVTAGRNSIELALMENNCHGSSPTPV